MTAMHERFDDFEIRPFTRDDVASITRHANDERVARQMRDRFPHPYAADDARAFFDLVARGESDAFAIAGPDGAFGTIGFQRRADVERFTAEVGFWLGATHWGRGIATRAVVAFVDWLFTTTDLERLEAVVFETNPASARVLEKAGFERESRRRRSIHKGGRMLDSTVFVRFR